MVSYFYLLYPIFTHGNPATMTSTMVLSSTDHNFELKDNLYGLTTCGHLFSATISASLSRSQNAFVSCSKSTGIFSSMALNDPYTGSLALLCNLYSHIRPQNARDLALVILHAGSLCFYRDLCNLPSCSFLLATSPLIS